MIEPSPLDLAYTRQVAPVPWAQFKAEVLKDYTPPKVTRGHYDRFLQVCKIMEGLGVESTSDLNCAMVDLFIDSRPPGQSKFTLRGLLVFVRTLCGKAHRYKYVHVSPFAIRPISKLIRVGKATGKRHLTRLECSRLLELLRGDVASTRGWAQWKARRLLATVSIGLYCGLRKMELLRLHVADLDLASRVIRLEPHNKLGRFKTDGSAASVPMPDALVPAIEDWLSHRLDHPAGMPIDLSCPWLIPTCSRKAPWTNGAPGTKPLCRFQAAARRAGIEDATLHALRRSCATHLEAFGVPRSMIARVLRHSSEKTTEDHYLRADEAIMVGAVKDFSF
jgi:integrase